MRIFNLGDTSITIELGNEISEALNDKVLLMQAWLQQHLVEGIKELIPAYCTLTVYYDPYIIKKKYQPIIPVYKWMEEKLKEAFEKSAADSFPAGIVHRIPVCYDEEFGIDIRQLAEQKKTGIEKIIEWHIARPYRVFMIGFMPGFPYLGGVTEQLAMPRKQKPVLVEAGSVGIAGNQTGIYPFKSPGGWNIIGRTPVALFEKDKEPAVTLKPGDWVQFYQITREEF